MKKYYTNFMYGLFGVVLVGTVSIANSYNTTETQKSTQWNNNGKICYTLVDEPWFSKCLDDVGLSYVIPTPINVDY